MTEIDRVRNQLTFSKKQTAYAWANHYNYVRAELGFAIQNHRQLVRVDSEETIPTHIKEEIKTMATALKKKWECPICLEMIEEAELEITNCGHFYCRGCLNHHQEASKGAARCACRRSCRRPIPPVVERAGPCPLDI